MDKINQEAHATHFRGLASILRMRTAILPGQSQSCSEELALKGVFCILRGSTVIQGSDADEM